jgi:hypothetical protein
MAFVIMFQLKFLNFKIKLWQLPIKLIHLLYWYIIVQKKFSTRWSFAKCSQHQQCFQVEHSTMLVNNMKHLLVIGLDTTCVGITI